MTDITIISINERIGFIACNIYEGCISFDTDICICQRENVYIDYLCSSNELIPQCTNIKCIENKISNITLNDSNGNNLNEIFQTNTLNNYKYHKLPIKLEEFLKFIDLIYKLSKIRYYHNIYISWYKFLHYMQTYTNLKIEDLDIVLRLLLNVTDDIIYGEYIYFNEKTFNQWLDRCDILHPYSNNNVSYVEINR